MKTGSGEHHYLMDGHKKRNKWRLGKVVTNKENLLGLSVALETK